MGAIGEPVGPAEREARLALNSVVEGATGAVSAAVAEYGAEAVWAGLAARDRRGPLAERARTFRSEPVLERADRLGLRFVVPGDSQWPIPLGDLEGCEAVNQMTGMPFGLWVSGGGDLAALAARSVAVVGSRACSSYGETVATDLAADLSEAGYAVVSGGAFGIDAAAHRGALAGRTPTVVVLPGGLDQAYPPAHRPLFDRIADRGVLVSELPSGQHPTRMRFLSRNRLIAALSPGTVLVEAAVRSGARNTVTWATALRRVVMAVPGPVTSATSYTPHRLIREAEAVLVASAGDVLELLGELGRTEVRPASTHRPTDDLDPTELRVFEAVPARGGLSAAELGLRAGVELPVCLAALDSLADQGFVVQDAQWSWRLAPRRNVEPLPGV
ncbi:MAG TPA: DNA-processing protein DprA [Propionicimonas sp.]|nr:DNA-processing protein DprA [Propionicimonas sp.]